MIQLLSDPFTNLVSYCGAHRERVELPGIAPAGRTITDTEDRTTRLAMRRQRAIIGSNQRVRFSGGVSVIPISTFIRKPEVIGKRYRCGSTFGPGDVSSPFLINLFQRTVTR